MADPIKIDGLAEFSRNLKTLDRNLPKALRVAFNQCADIVVNQARPAVPSKSGRASGSVRAKSTQTASRVSGGGNRAPYYPWLDFGGRVGRNHSIKRPFLKDGRYIYAAFFANRTKYKDAMEDALVQVAAQAGIEVE